MPKRPDNKDTSSAQLAAWQGEFGDDYVDRNSADEVALAARTKMWTRILDSLSADPPATILEVGANLGLNLRSLDRVTSARLMAVEPNQKARDHLIADGVVRTEDVHDGIAAAIPLPDSTADLVFTSGVLIHIAPDDLLASCREIHRVAKRYVLSIEYFADRPEEVEYRGREGLLFKRDFGDFWMNNFTDLSIVDYGFFWRRVTTLDNLTWWLFQKRRQG